MLDFIKPQSNSSSEHVVFVGLDVHKRTIYLAARQWKTWLLEKVFDTQDLSKLFKSLKSLQKHGVVRLCYEASGAGFWLHRKLSERGFHCEVIAPSLIPKKPGQKKKCDRLDAQQLAEYLASGLLTAVRIPTPEEEADRDLIRLRFTLRKDITKNKHRVLKFLARKDRQYRATPWTLGYYKWLSEQEFELSTEKLTFRHLLEDLTTREARLREVDNEIRLLSETPRYSEQVRVLRGFRGVETLTAMVFLTELGDLDRFANPRQLMAYLGLVPSIHDSGERQRRGSITKAGNGNLRHVLVQATWCYFGRMSLGGRLAERQQDLPAWALGHSLRTQERINKRVRHLEQTRGRCIAVVAAARELACFLAAALKELKAKQAEGFKLPSPDPERAEKRKKTAASTKMRRLATASQLTSEQLVSLPG